MRPPPMQMLCDQVGPVCRSLSVCVQPHAKSYAWIYMRFYQRLFTVI